MLSRDTYRATRPNSAASVSRSVLACVKSVSRLVPYRHTSFVPGTILPIGIHAIRDMFSSNGLVIALQENVHTALMRRKAIDRATDVASRDEGAWIMRRAFDSILSGAVAAQERAAAIAAAAGGSGEYLMMSFESGLPTVPRWRILDDVVRPCKTLK